MHAEHDDGDFGIGLGDLKSGFNAVEIGHADVHDDYIGLQGFCEGDGFSAVVGFAHNREIGLLLDEETQTTADEFVIVGKEDTNFSHGWIIAGSGRIRLMEREFGFYGGPSSRCECNRESAAEAADAFFHAEDAHTALAGGIEAVAVIRDFYGDLIGILSDAYFGVFGGGVRGGVVEGFLRDAVDGDFGFVAESFRDVFRVNFDFHLAAPRNLAGLPFEGGDQAEIVEHGRTEEKCDVADGFDCGFGNGFYLGDLGLRDAVFGRDEFRELADFDQERT
jgi:hypothetical protein